MDAVSASATDDGQASCTCEASYLFAWRKRACGACRATRLEIVQFGKPDRKWRAPLLCPRVGPRDCQPLRLSGVGEDEPPVCGEREAGEREARGKQLRYGLSLEWRHARARWRLLAEG